ncbi:MAG TPA: hypothetical protein VN720_09855 [Rudaea sp.]|nr:hypothetical protein [Rudaea sp.]
MPSAAFHYFPDRAALRAFTVPQTCKSAKKAPPSARVPDASGCLSPTCRYRSLFVIPQRADRTAIVSCNPYILGRLQGPGTRYCEFGQENYAAGKALSNVFFDDGIQPFAAAISVDF